MYAKIAEIFTRVKDGDDSCNLFNLIISLSLGQVWSDWLKSLGKAYPFEKHYTQMWNLHVLLHSYLEIVQLRGTDLLLECKGKIVE